MTNMNVYPWAPADLVQKMLQRFVHAGAEFLFRNPAAGASHRFFHFWDRVGRTSRERRVTPIEHREIVVMVAAGEDGSVRDFREARQLLQGGALVIIGVAKAQVNRVALIMKFRTSFAFARSMNSASRSISSSLVAITPAGLFGFVDDTRFRFAPDELNDLREDDEALS